MFQSPHSASPDLGTLSSIPLEIRERIYSLVLDFNEPPPDIKINPNLSEPPFPCHCACHAGNAESPEKEKPPKLSLLLVSRAVHNEAKLVLFRINEWKIEVDRDCPRGLARAVNISIMGLPGWSMKIGHVSKQGRALSLLPTEMLDRDNLWSELRFVNVSVGSGGGCPDGGIMEYDILPWKHQTKAGPERPSFVPLLKVMDNVCELLGRCRQLHLLRITLRSMEKTPGSIEMVLDPLRQLRGVRKTSAVCMGMQDDMWVDWNLKGSYGRYLDKILSMPQGTKAPKYIGDEKEPNQSDKEIFDMVGARWCGGKTFAYPSDSEDEDVLDDDLEFIYDDEMGEFEEFLDHIGASGIGMSLGMGFVPGGPNPWDDGGPADWANGGPEDEDEDDEGLRPFGMQASPGQYHGFEGEYDQDSDDQAFEDVD